MSIPLNFRRAEIAAIAVSTPHVTGRKVPDLLANREIAYTLTYHSSKTLAAVVTNDPTEAKKVRFWWSFQATANDLRLHPLIASSEISRDSKLIYKFY